MQQVELQLVLQMEQLQHVHLLHLQQHLVQEQKYLQQVHELHLRHR